MMIEKGDGSRYALLFPRRETGGHTSSSRVLCAETMGRSWSWARRITNTGKMGAAIKRPHDTGSQHHPGQVDRGAKSVSMGRFSRIS